MENHIIAIVNNPGVVESKSELVVSSEQSEVI